MIQRKNSRRNIVLMLVCAILLFMSLAGYSSYLPQEDQKGSRISGLVVDEEKQSPIVGATVYHNSKHYVTESDGKFVLVDIDPSEPVRVKAPGYRRASVSIPNNSGRVRVSLQPLKAKGLYLTHYGVGNKEIRSRAIDLIKETELNALVIDVKGDRGWISYKSEIPMAKESGALKVITVKDMPGLLADLKKQNIYTIARIVVFKDNVLAQYKPEWAVTDTRTKKPWIDNEHLAWVDPFRKEVWKYNIDLAKEAAKLGFDEIQFDYIRFPTDGKIGNAAYSKENNMESRMKAINGFLSEAQEELLPYNVYLSMDIFGYVCWNSNDTSIGQKLEEVAKYVDYLSPMVYPSAYHLGIPGYRYAVAYPQEVVYHSLRKASERLKDLHLPIKIRPWLQNFRDYAYDKRTYTATEIRAQIIGATKAGACGWLLWDPRNLYTHTKEAVNKERINISSKQAGS